MFAVSRARGATSTGSFELGCQPNSLVGIPPHCRNSGSCRGAASTVSAAISETERKDLPEAAMTSQVVPAPPPGLSFTVVHYHVSKKKSSSSSSSSRISAFRVFCAYRHHPNA